MGFVPGFAQVSSKPRGGQPSTEGAGFPGLFSSYLYLDTQRLQRGRNWQGYAGIHIAWALWAVLETNKFYKGGLIRWKCCEFSVTSFLCICPCWTLDGASDTGFAPAFTWQNSFCRGLSDAREKQRSVDSHLQSDSLCCETWFLGIHNRSQRARAIRAVSKQPKSSYKGTWGVWIKKSGCSAGICRFSSVHLNSSGSRLQASAGISPFLSLVQQKQTWTVSPESLWDKG